MNPITEWKRRRALKARIKDRLRWLALSDEEQRMWRELPAKIAGVGAVAKQVEENIRAACVRVEAADVAARKEIESLRLRAKRCAAMK